MKQKTKTGLRIFVAAAALCVCGMASAQLAVTPSLPDKAWTRKMWLPRFGDMIMPKIAKVNELIRPFADGKNVEWFDLTGTFLDSDGLPDIRLLPDGTHPGPEGYAVWADALLPYLKNIRGM